MKGCPVRQRAGFPPDRQGLFHLFFQDHLSQVGSNLEKERGRLPYSVLTSIGAGYLHSQAAGLCPGACGACHSGLKRCHTGSGHPREQGVGAASKWPLHPRSLSQSTSPSHSCGLSMTPETFSSAVLAPLPTNLAS